MVSKIPRNEIFEKYGLPPDLKIGSNKAGSKPASAERPVHYGEWDVASNSGYVVGDNMINEPPPGKPFKIAFIGAGAAGIDFLHHAPSVLQGLGVEIVCYDKNENVGGTWYENRYPGCACDVPSVSYAFPWRPNPCWTSFYSSAQEIWQYMRDIVDEEGMMKYIQLRTEIISATWDEDHSKWHLKVRRTAPETNEAPIEWEDSCDLLLNGGGFLK